MKAHREPSPEQNRLSNEVIGAAIEVHRELGPGLRELRYKLALNHELALRGITAHREVPYESFYKGLSLGIELADMVVQGQLIVEAKAAERLLPLHKAQLISYLKLSRICLGLLINFNVPVLKDGIQRVVYFSDDQ